MANQVPNRVGIERKAHAVLAAALGAACLLVGTAAKNERAVFLTEGTGLSAKAFAAMVPPESMQRKAQGAGFPGTYALANNVAQRPGGGLRMPRSPGAIDDLLAPRAALTAAAAPQGTTASMPADAGASQLASLTPSQFAPGVFQPGGGGVGTGERTSAATGGTGTGGTGTGTGGTGTGGTGTGGTGTGGIGTGTSGTGTGVTGGTIPPADPVAAVPEAATWEMLLTGFFAIGVALRRRPMVGPIKARV